MVLHLCGKYLKIIVSFCLSYARNLNTLRFNHTAITEGVGRSMHKRLSSFTMFLSNNKYNFKWQNLQPVTDTKI